ncbi:29264baf-db52-4f96-af6c-63838e1c0fc7 [Thermothielavioides terrestris]|uniref:29264baf-db52-4f96-af6c-63838e1c0fc7 n=1 Tax=Thermothielavioides terrestris TaxID=2587410 RepID=A0A3S4C415_9PEZI|nr:29264baf-db52-4f96-af6c-63838e1c0fc7 [Thermothielavioides terrestris]
MPTVINLRDLMSEQGRWLRVNGPDGCTCGRYVFYLECGHLARAPLLFVCSGTISETTGQVRLCYYPARLIHVYDIVIQGRCSHCRSYAS